MNEQRKVELVNKTKDFLNKVLSALLIMAVITVCLFVAGIFLAWIWNGAIAQLFGLNTVGLGAGVTLAVGIAIVIAIIEDK